MAEADWQKCSRLYDMLRQLGRRNSPWRWTTRKSRLFACACCRRIWPILTEPLQREAVERAEEAADKRIRLTDLAAAHKAARPVHLGRDSSSLAGFAGTMSVGNWEFFVHVNTQREMFCNPGGSAATPTAWGNPYSAANDARALLHFRGQPEASRVEQLAQCDLLRDIAGPPQAPVIRPEWLIVNDRAVPKLAESIYEERSFDGLPILADALEDAGCTDRKILDHLRGPGPHVPGCWVIDACQLQAEAPRRDSVRSAGR